METVSLSVENMLRFLKSFMVLELALKFALIELSLINVRIITHQLVQKFLFFHANIRVS